MKRYDINCYTEYSSSYLEYELDSVGDWCKYSDVEELIELNKEILEVLKQVEGVLWEAGADIIPVFYCLLATNAVEKAESFNE